MVDVRAHREAFRFQAGSAATITVTAVDDSGDPVDLTSHTLTLTPNDGTAIVATTSDPAAGTRVFSFTDANTTALDDAGRGTISLADGNGDEWVVGSAWASTVGTSSQDHEVSVTLGSANIAITVSAAIGAGGGGGVELPIEQSDVTGLEAALAGKADTGDIPAMFQYVGLVTPTTLGEADDFISGTSFAIPPPWPVPGGVHEVLVTGTSNGKDGAYTAGDTVEGVQTFTLSDTQPAQMQHRGRRVGVSYDMTSAGAAGVYQVAPDGEGGTTLEHVGGADVPRVYNYDMGGAIAEDLPGYAISQNADNSTVLVPLYAGLRVLAVFYMGPGFVEDPAKKGTIFVVDDDDVTLVPTGEQMQVGEMAMISGQYEVGDDPLLMGAVEQGGRGALVMRHQEPLGIEAVNVGNLTRRIASTSYIVNLNAASSGMILGTTAPWPGLVVCDPAGGSVTANLAGLAYHPGQEITFLRVSSGTVVFEAQPDETIEEIDGTAAGTYTMTERYMRIRNISGQHWRVIESSSAATVEYDNTTSGLTAETVQDAVDELASTSGGSGVWQLVSDQTLDEAAASVTFSDLGSYTEIEVRFRGASSTSAAGIAFLHGRLNGDTGSNYNHVRTGGQVTASFVARNGGAAGATAMVLGEVSGSQTNQDRRSTGVVTLRCDQPAASRKVIDARTRGGRSNENTTFTYDATGEWTNTADAVSSLTLFLDSGNWVAGSRFEVFAR